MSDRVTLTDDLLHRTLLGRSANHIAENALVDGIVGEIARIPQARRSWGPDGCRRGD